MFTGFRASIRSSNALRNSISSFTTEVSKSRYVPRRALLYLPADNQKMLSKASKIQHSTLKVDCLVLEMEDGVAATSKVEARNNVRQYLDDLDIKGKHSCIELGVRVNSVASQLLYDDVKEISKAKHLPQAFMVPKVDSIDDVATIFDAFRSAFGESRIQSSETRLVIWIESARAILDLPRILNATVNLNRSANFFKIDAAVFGSDDFCADIGATRTRNATENIYSRQRFVTCCKAFGLQAIDSVYIDIKDVSGLKEQCKEGKEWGFTGKQAIHPSQIDIIQQEFLPSKEKLEWAENLVKEFIEHEKAGKGAFIFRGHMIDRPLLLQAMNALKLMSIIEQKQ